MKVKKTALSGARKALLIAESVAVLCPHCSEPQPDGTGSELWTPESFIHTTAKRACVSCDEPFILAHERKVMFDLPKRRESP